MIILFGRLSPPEILFRLNRLSRVVFFLALAGSLGGGCGYRMETAKLPDNAESLGIGTIRNLTYKGELDIRLKNILRRRLLRNPAISVISPDRSQLILEIDLKKLIISRTQDVSDTDITSFGYTLKGEMQIIRAGPEKKVVLKKNIVAISVLSFNQPVIETPAVIDDAANEVMIIFAKKVEQGMFIHF